MIQATLLQVPRMLCIDPMHNLFLSTGKHMITVWEKQGYLI